MFFVLNRTHVVLPITHPGPRREFHVARSARDTYEFPDDAFSLQGHVLFADIRSARTLAMKMNTVRRSALHPERAVRAGDIYAMGLIDEVFHHMIGLYLEQYGTSVMEQLEEVLRSALGTSAFERLLLTFSERFPTVAHYHGTESAEESLDRTVSGISGRQVAIEEMIVLWVGNRNPAFSPLIELFDEEIIALDTDYARFSRVMQEFFDSRPSFGPEDQTLINLLRAPAIAHPDDLHAQLEYIRTKWGAIIGPYLDRLLRSVDMITEERKARFAGPPGEAPVLEYGSFETSDEDDYARFSPDREWMPRAVIIAKSTLVWLDQLSKEYKREIRTLDQVPDEELDILAGRGFTGLWLIGLWERSGASKRIKHLCGNPEAEASAYSLYDYDVAQELGGWDALDNLRRRLWQRGIRIASDMVPNHSGIDSKWVHEHPEWFIGLPYVPFPGYTFNGENLSTQPGVGIYLEDHYYDRSDAAVVFKRVHFDSGDTRYIYHGNDGTSMPWNDTAQLDYLNPEVRETVIQTILHVARNFPIIRFDAAMTLAKKHIQRLWYPAPGQGGDIPSRSEHGLPQAEFDAAMPQEFWREVVDRVAQEVPDTLLLAEAFWMMEGYFVRNLGMHRVYNSAFMNMLKNEDNEKYRRTIKNTLEYDPEILKRFVNFMNNPDEESAVAQFGTGDKYFGVATLMVTMPGLPMWGHGQIEGFAEKYGMEYRHAYWDETADESLIARHNREIFPLMHRRYLFADATNFRLFDVYAADGHVHPHVYAYTNHHHDERTLVLYNNFWERAEGWIHTSSPFVVDASVPTDQQELRSEQLTPSLGLSGSWQRFTIFQEQRSGLWFIRNSGELSERGLYVALNGYESQVFLNIYEVEDNQYTHYARLADSLNGAGTADINRSLKRLLLQPLHDAFGVVANTGVLRRLTDALATPDPKVDWKELADEYRSFLSIAGQFSEHTTRMEDAAELFERNGEALIRLPQLVTRAPKTVAALIESHLTAEREDSSVFLALALLIPLDVFVQGEEELTSTLRGFRALDQAAEWELITHVASVMEHLSAESHLPRHWEPLVQLILAHHGWWSYTGGSASIRAARTVMETLLADPNVEDFLQIHVHNGVTWFNKEMFELMVDWLVVVAVWQEMTAMLISGTRVVWKELVAYSRRVAEVYREWQRAQKTCGYKVEALLEALAGEGELAGEGALADVPPPGDATSAAPQNTGRTQPGTTRAPRRKTTKRSDRDE
ncbi:MAG: alpha-amylase family glycosyl hydrolase [Alkalispirochaeta sp.]